MKFIITIFLISLTACVSLPMVSSVSEKPEGKYEYSYYNKESQVLYKVTNDDKNLHVILNTTSQASILKILKTGLTIYFDISGKKKQDVFVHYPYKLNYDLKKEDYKKDANTDPNKKNLNYFVSQIPAELIFSDHNATEHINLHDVNIDIKDSITVLHNDEIIYELIIPLSRISKKGLFSLANLSIGVVSGKFDIPTARNVGGTTARPGGISSGVGASGGMPSGSNAGNMANQPSDDIPSAAGSTGDSDLSTMGIPIEFWFKVKLVP